MKSKNIKDLSKYFKEDGEPIRCPNCESEDLFMEYIDYLEHIHCEGNCICNKCHKIVNYWAYGNWQPIEDFKIADKKDINNVLYSTLLVKNCDIYSIDGYIIKDRGNEIKQEQFEDDVTYIIRQAMKIGRTIVIQNDDEVKVYIRDKNKLEIYKDIIQSQNLKNCVQIMEY